VARVGVASVGVANVGVAANGVVANLTIVRTGNIVPTGTRATGAPLDPVDDAVVPANPASV
jgi:hypothetical protein